MNWKSLPVWLSVTVRAVVCLALLGVALRVTIWLAATKPQPRQSGPSTQPLQVLVMRAAAVSLPRQWQGFGAAAAMDAADISAEVAGLVAEVPEAARAGRTVKKGDLLARIKDGDYREQLKAAEQAVADLDAQLARMKVEVRTVAERLDWERQSLAIAQSELERVEKLFKEGVARPADVEQARRVRIDAARGELAARDAVETFDFRRQSLAAQREAQQQQAEQARRNLERCAIASPLDGVIQMIAVDEGWKVSPGQLVARVVSRARMEVPLRLPAVARFDLAQGDRATLWAQQSPATGGGSGAAAGADPDAAADACRQTWSGVIARLSPDNDPATRTFLAFVEVQQVEGAADLLVPGQFVEGVVDAGGERTVWIVPRRAVLDDRLWLAEAGRAVSRPAAVNWSLSGDFPRFGLPDRQWVVLARELAPGQLVLVSPSRSLEEGHAVAPLPAEAVNPPAAAPRVQEAAP